MHEAALVPDWTPKPGFLKNGQGCDIMPASLHTKYGDFDGIIIMAEAAPDLLGRIVVLNHERSRVGRSHLRGFLKK
jgi:hypothetical protein